MNPIGIKISNSLLDVMQDGREFESLLGYQYNNLDVLREIKSRIYPQPIFPIQMYGECSYQRRMNLRL